jgi:hypothetical protein
MPVKWCIIISRFPVSHVKTGEEDVVLNIQCPFFMAKLTDSVSKLTEFGHKHKKLCYNG